MKKSSLFLYGLLAFGALLIWFVFSLFAGKSGAITPTEWLVLAVIGANYLLVFLDVPLLFGGTSSFSARIPFLGISLQAQFLFAIVSIAFIVVGATLGIPFKFLLLGEGVLAFVFLVNVFLSVLAGEKVGEVARAEQNLLQPIQGARRELDKLVLLAKGKPFCAPIVPALERAAETLRYTSPVDSAPARALDAAISSGIGTLRQLLGSTPDAASWDMGKADIQRATDALTLSIGERKTLRN